MNFRKPSTTDKHPARADTIRLAIIHSTHRIVFTAAAVSEHGLAQPLGEYVQERADSALWPDDARRVLGLLASGRTSEAVTAYFAAVGTRWDPEHLYLRTVPVQHGTSSVGLKCPK